PDGTPYWEPVLSNVFDGLLEGGDATYLPDPTILFIRNVSEDDAGLYTCVAGNQIGFTYASAYLTVLEPVNETYLLMMEKVEAHHTSSTLSTSILLFLIASMAIIIFAICLKYHGQKRNKEPEKSSDQTILLPKKEGFLSPRYLGNGLKQDFNFHYDSDLALDSQWEISRDDITLIKSCGEGAFGQVFMGELRLRKCQDYPMQMQRTKIDSSTAGDYNQSLVDDVDGDEYDHVIVAVKMLKDNATRQEFNDLISEMQVMKQVCQAPKHSNVIDLIGCCTQGG
uniref:Receptor protein-tyrosine kinase n=1 Tax=Romanomermis culicivorax TaxID=13658 RepID=A0A915HQG8_ROMCU